jgi:flavin reductase (DIM6/NTAB) family NADH-FMN oxidoreductase RutF
MIALAMGKSHYTNIGIHEHKEFSVNPPGMDLIEPVDYYGLVSGKKQDKSGIFQVFTGDLEYAPMIQNCPVTMECRLVEAVDLPSNTLFIGEIVGAYTEEQYLTDGQPDIRKIKPFT